MSSVRKTNDIRTAKPLFATEEDAAFASSCEPAFYFNVFSNGACYFPGGAWHSAEMADHWAKITPGFKPVYRINVRFKVPPS